MTGTQAAVLLAAAIAARSTSLLFSKLLLVDMGPLTLLGLRFALAFAVLAVLFRRRLRSMGKETLARGSLMGVALFATMAFELLALTRTPSSTVAFLENTAVVIVPVATALLARKLPSARIATAALLALGGVGLVTLAPAASGMAAADAAGDPAGIALVMGAACCYSAVIVVTARFSKTDDAMSLGVVQTGVVGALGLAAAFAFEQPALPSTGVQWACLLELVVVCTGFGFTVQPMAQRFLSADTAGMLCAITPLVGGVLGIAFLGEPFGPATFVGMALILAAVVLAGRSDRQGEGEETRLRPRDRIRNRTWDAGSLAWEKTVSAKVAGAPGFEPR